MAKAIYKAGRTQIIERVQVNNSSLPYAGGLTGVSFNTAGLTIYWSRKGDISLTQMTPLVAGTIGTWISNGWVEVDATHAPGLYEVSLPDAALAVGVDSVVFYIQGVTNMVPIVIELALVGYDPLAGTVISAGSVTAPVTLSSADETALGTIAGVPAGVANLLLANPGKPLANNSADGTVSIDLSQRYDGANYTKGSHGHLLHHLWGKLFGKATIDSSAKTITYLKTDDVTILYTDTFDSVTSPTLRNSGGTS